MGDTETQKILFRPRLDDRSVGAWRKRKERNAQNQQSNAAANTKARYKKSTKMNSVMNRSAVPQSVSSTRDNRSGDVAV